MGVYFVLLLQSSHQFPALWTVDAFRAQPHDPTPTPFVLLAVCGLLQAMSSRASLKSLNLTRFTFGLLAERKLSLPLESATGVNTRRDFELQRGQSTGDESSKGRLVSKTQPQFVH